eukprot:SAG11_NODE_341_length_10462_cov_49.272990_7_plen_154_part_00
MLTLYCRSRLHTCYSRQVREVDRVDDVEVKDQEDDAMPCAVSVNTRAHLARREPRSARARLASTTHVNTRWRETTIRKSLRKSLRESRETPTEWKLNTRLTIRSVIARPRGRAMNRGPRGDGGHSRLSKSSWRSSASKGGAGGDDKPGCPVLT